MHHEIGVLGMLVPSLFICAIAAGGLWFVVDGLMLRRGWWEFFLHPPLARLALFVVLVAAVAGCWPDF